MESLFQLLSDLDMQVYSASAELSSEKKASTLSTSIIISFLFAFSFVAVLFLIVQQGRKRKILSAPIWRPPLNDSGNFFQYLSCPEFLNIGNQISERNS